MAITDATIINLFKEARQIEQDQEVAAELGLTPSYISQTIRGTRALGIISRLKILQLIGYKPAAQVIQMLQNNEMVELLTAKAEEARKKPAAKKQKERNRAGGRKTLTDL